MKRARRGARAYWWSTPRRAAAAGAPARVRATGCSRTRRVAAARGRARRFGARAPEASAEELGVRTFGAAAFDEQQPRAPEGPPRARLSAIGARGRARPTDQPPSSRRAGGAPEPRSRGGGGRSAVAPAPQRAAAARAPRAPATVKPPPKFRERDRARHRAPCASASARHEHDHDEATACSRTPAGRGRRRVGLAERSRRRPSSPGFAEAVSLNGGCRAAAGTTGKGAGAVRGRASSRRR